MKRIEERARELVISGGDSPIDLQGSDHALDVVALAIDAPVPLDFGFTRRFGRNAGADACVMQAGADGFSVVAFGAFCLTLAFTGARISEALALTAERLDASNEAIVFETLKQRRRGVFRAVPIPRRLLCFIMDTAHSLKSNATTDRLWPWGRTNAWKQVKRVMKAAGLSDALCKPKALRHGFAIDAGQNGVPLNIVQRWLGHARIETTAIYAGAIGEEKRNLARRMWKSVEGVFRDS